MMDTGSFRIESTGLTRLTGIAGSFSGWFDKGAVKYLRAGFVWLPAVLIVGFWVWTILSGSASHTAEDEPVRLATAVATEPVPSPTVDTAQDEAPLNPATLPMEAITRAESAPVDGLKIASQSWRRGGLGSNALVTFTMRNGNDYAVKDIEIFCTFSRKDGSPLTARTHVIHDTVNRRSRKTFARMHIGFVNINADQAKCSLVAASHV